MRQEPLFQDIPEAFSDYEPYSSVIWGTDAVAIPMLFKLHAPDSRVIVDVTANEGRFWRGTGIIPVRLDYNPETRPDCVADFMALPLRAGSVDVLVFDPPHVPDHGNRGYRETFGIKTRPESKQPGRNNQDYLFPPFFTEAHRVLADKGLVFCKIIDQVTNQVFHWQHIALVIAAREAGFTPCDLLIVCNPSAGSLTSSRWKTAYHFRKSHCFWIVVRKGKKCHRTAITYPPHDPERTRMEPGKPRRF